MDKFDSTPEAAQRLLDELHAACISAAFVDELPRTGRKAAIKVLRQKLRHIKGQIKLEKDAIKAQWDARKKDEALAETLYLLPYLALEKLISKIEVSLSELEAAMTTGAPIPDPPQFGSILYGQSTNDGAKINVQWEIISEETFAQRQADLASQIQGSLVQARALIQQKQYAAARVLLKQTDHPKAREWLAKLDEVDHPSRTGAVILEALSKSPNRSQQNDTAKSIAILFWILVALAAIIATALGTK